MRRLPLAAILLAVTLLGATPSDAFWRHHAWGRGGCGYGGWGYRGYGWRGCGWGGYPAYGYGGCGYGGYPGYSVGYYPDYYPAYCAPWYGCSTYGYRGYGAGYGEVLARLPAVGRYRVATAPRFNFDRAPNALVLQEFLGLKSSKLALAREDRLRPVDNRVTEAGLATILTRVASIESRRKAERLLRDGDELFRAQDFHFALQKYKLAASTAPDLAEALWRKGHALIATHNYELAAAAFKRASALSEEVGRSGFQLSEIYGGAAMTKTQHLESLAEWALARSDSPDPYFLLGVFLHYDGQPARAGTFFAKAADLAGISGGHIAVFQAPATVASKVARDRTVAPSPAIPILPISVETEI